MGVLGVSTIKFLYFYMKNKNELEMNSNDYSIIGGISAVYLSYIALGSVIGFKYIFFLSGFGIFYGLFYNWFTKYLIFKRKRKAEQIGIIL
jgi:hypothetical protein